MNILHVLSQFEVTGAETFAATLINEQVKHGHKIVLVSDTFNTPVSAEYIPMRIHKRDFLQRLKNIRALRKIIIERSINIVHSHSRAASWVSFFATRFTKIPLVSSIHGKQHIHFSSKKLKIFGEKLMPVCEILGTQIFHDLNIPVKKIHLVRNGIDLEHFKSLPGTNSIKIQNGIKKDDIIISLIGRLSGPKGEIAKTIIKDVFPVILSRVPDVTFFIIGGMKVTPDFENLVNAINNEIGKNRIIFLEYKSNVNDYINSSDIVIGSGRVAMESLAMEKPVIAIGESMYIGIVSEEYNREALETNFGDSGEKQHFDPAKMTKDLMKLIFDPDLRNQIGIWGRDFVKQEYDIRIICKKIQKIYQQTIYEKGKIPFIPILIYHKITDMPVKDSKHGTWVLKRNFELQLQSLKKRGFKTITFDDILNYQIGQKNLPQKPIMLTFDDGYEDNFTNAFFLLKKYGMAAVIFLVSKPGLYINKWDIIEGEPVCPLLNKEEILQMSANGIEFGSHTINHSNLKDLSDEQIRSELFVSKKTLESLIGKPVLSICYPYGAVNESVKKVAELVGYKFGVASYSGPLLFGSDMYEIRRIQIFPNTGKFGFWKKTSSWYLKYKAFKERIKL